jgi:hypothetical protein
LFGQNVRILINEIIMQDLLGWVFLLIVFVVILILPKKHSHIKNILLVAFILRAIVVVFDQYELIRLPDGYADASKFETLAREFSRNQGLSVLFDFFIPDSFLISRIISIFYTIFGENKMMAQSISVLLGVGSVYLVYKLCLNLWDYCSAQKAAWVTALFPILILYSSITLRETYIIFFLLIGLNSIAKFMKDHSFISLLQVLFSFYVLTFFHGPAAIGGFVFLTYLLLNLIKKQLILLYNFKINILSFFLIIIYLIPLILFANNYIQLPYIGGIKTLFNLDKFIPKINNYINDTASYPEWFIITNNLEFYSKGIIKIFYFVYSPFIWDIESYHHLLGLFDGILYIILTIYVIKNWQAIWENPITRLFILLFIVYIIIYGISIGNFGAATRHRSKFVVILIVLAAPKLHKFIFSTKNKIYKK